MVAGYSSVVAESQLENLARSRRALALGAATMIGGLFVAGTLSRDVGGAIVLGSWIVLLWAIHTFGRAAS